MTDSSEADFETDLRAHYEAALDEIVKAVLSQLAKGQSPRRENEATFSLRDSGLPSLSDGNYFSPTGACKFTALLDPPYGDEAAKREGRYPLARYPALHRLQAFAVGHPNAPSAHLDGPPDFTRFHIQFQVEQAADAHLEKFGAVDTTPASRGLLLGPVLKGQFLNRLPLAAVVPIALVRFDFDRFRLARDAIILRMSPDLQKARWTGRARGGNGHDSVLAAATHAVVITGWGIDNADFLQLSRSLSQSTPERREAMDAVFAALRLETGVQTGYAQEFFLARGWRSNQPVNRPEVYASGARQYPEAFDDFGWMRDDVPVVSREQMLGVKTTYDAIRQTRDSRLRLALRRFNAATIRESAADSVLDATIGLEVLLGDSEPQAISWKLRMRAAALAGLEGDKSAMTAARDAVSQIYDVRSVIVHGLSGKKAKKAGDPAMGARLAVEILRSTLKTLLRNPRYLDPLKIDRELLMVPQLRNPRPSG